MVTIHGFYCTTPINFEFGCYNALSNSHSPQAGKDAALAKVNYQYEKRQKELEKKRKKEQKERERQKRKNNPSQDVVITQETPATPPVQSPEK
jgi:hypothetical protein